jgi:hypothetical protein
MIFLLFLMTSLMYQLPFRPGSTVIRENPKVKGKRFPHYQVMASSIRISLVEGNVPNALDDLLSTTNISRVSIVCAT